LAAGLVLAAALVLFASDSVISGATPTPLNKGLVRDASAELATGATDGYTVVPIPGWITTGNFTAARYGEWGCPSVDQAARIGGGKIFFYGGPDNARSTARQDVRLVGRSTAIDQGRLKVKLSAWLGGYDGQGDSARLLVQFRDSLGGNLGWAQTPKVSASDSVLVHKTASKRIPAGTRSLRVVLISIRADGSYNDGMFDKIDVRIVSV
jgi:hypothetical protein